MNQFHRLSLLVVVLLFLTLVLMKAIASLEPSAHKAFDIGKGRDCRGHQALPAGPERGSNQGSEGSGQAVR